MLSGAKIKEEVRNGNIFIENFNENHINPNSYDLHIQDKVVVYNMDANIVLDPTHQNLTKTITIPDGGLVLKPGTLYLLSTKEKIWSDKYVPCITGRSSYARLGIQVHQTAFFANLGDEFRWTLEVTAVHPVVIYKNLKLAQVYFEEVVGDIETKYSGKYYGQTEATPSRSYKD